MNKWENDVIKFRIEPNSGMVVMTNKTRTILGEQPMDKVFELLFNNRKTMYCNCRFRREDGYLSIGAETEGDF